MQGSHGLLDIIDAQNCDSPCNYIRKEYDTGQGAIKAHPRNLPEWQRSSQISSVEIIECFRSLPLWSTPSTSVVSILGPVLLEFEGVSDWAWPTLTSSAQIVILCAIIEAVSYQAIRATHDNTLGIYQNDNASIKLLVPKWLKVPGALPLWCAPSTWESIFCAGPTTLKNLWLSVQVQSTKQELRRR